MGDINTNIRIDRLEGIVDDLATTVSGMEETAVHAVTDKATITYAMVAEWMNNDEAVLYCRKKGPHYYVSIYAEITATKITFYYIEDTSFIKKIELLKNGGWQTPVDAGLMLIPTPTDNDTGGVLTATGEGTVEWAL